MLKVYSPAKNPESLVKELEAAVDKEMEDNRQGFGSADFFHALCDPAYFHLWLIGSEYEQNDVKDFIPHYVSYSEWREDLIELLRGSDGGTVSREQEPTANELEKLAKKPIAYTWTGLLNRHKKPSYRYYDFTAGLNTALEIKSLFRRVRPSDDRKEVTEYKKLTGEAAKFTLAARRLKRDKVINKDTGNSVDALWCPPLVLAGETNPTAEEHPRAGKYDDQKKKVWPTGNAEVSFSLIASPLPGDYWNEVAGVPSAMEKAPVHLTVSFKIEAEALAKLEVGGVYFAGKSLKGVDEEDEKRKFFRWPVDIESDKLAAKEAEDKAKQEVAKDGKAPRKQTKRIDVKPTELWCHYEDGFRVKASRYSKTEQTKKVPDFHMLSIDLGNRFAAAFTRLRIHADSATDGRVISADGISPVIKAQLTRQGTLRLQGEDAEVWQLVTEKNQKHIAKKLKARGETRAPVVGTYVLVEEKFGNGGRGRFPTPDEYESFRKLAGRLVSLDACSIAGTETQTYPELGDHLIFRLKRRIGRLRTLLNLVWRLCGDKEKDRNGKYMLDRKPELLAFHRRLVIETLARSAFPKRPRQPGETEDEHDQSLRLVLARKELWVEWKPLLVSKKGKEEETRCKELERIALKNTELNWLRLAEAMRKQIADYCEGSDSLDNLLVQAIEFCLPLRGRHWGWDRSRKARLHWDVKEATHVPRVEGMRGLSMRRLEQILNLRQRCQSFAKLEDRYHCQFKSGNYNPPDSIPREQIDDVCPLLLDRSNRIRDQRVEQTAHMILAEALGLELKNPAKVDNKKQRKSEVELHGEYQQRKDCPRCSVIVLENLERYKTSQERTRTENSRLMKWAHRAIIEKLEDMCRPFGITLMLVDPAFSSHFDSRTGLPGVRVNEVSRDFEKEYPYNKWLEGKTKSVAETQLAQDIKVLADTFAKNQAYKGTLILAVEGGKEFVPVASPAGQDGLINADICAAGNIGLRAIADPQRWDIFPRLRTKQVSETEVSVTTWRGWFGRFGKEAMERRITKLASSETPQLHAPVPQHSKKKKDAPTGDAGAGNGESASSQSSEFPPFFVEHPEHDWLPEGDWLKKEAFAFDQAGKKLRAYQQGEYLKRVEQVCSDRIKKINRARIQKPKSNDDNIVM